MTSIAFLFPGQGSQTPEMGKSLYEASDIARAIFDRAGTVIDLDVKNMCFNESEDELKKTENTQPCLFTIGVALHEVLKEELNKKNIKGVYYAGHSLGEITALAASAKISFDDGLTIARKRGKIMASAGLNGKYGMAAVIGLTLDNVENVCEKIKDVVVANYNSSEQIVISGTLTSIEAASNVLKEKGAKMIVPLKVDGAFHSPFMKNASEKFDEVLEPYALYDNNNKLISNVTADFHEYEDIKKLLVKQMYSRVKWKECVEKLRLCGVDTAFEVGPGKALSGLVKKICPDITVYNVFDIETIKNAVANIV